MLVLVVWWHLHTRHAVLLVTYSIYYRPAVCSVLLFFFVFCVRRTLRGMLGFSQVVGPVFAGCGTLHTCATAGCGAAPSTLVLPTVVPVA